MNVCDEAIVIALPAVRFWPMVTVPASAVSTILPVAVAGAVSTANALVPMTTSPPVLLRSMPPLGASTLTFVTSSVPAIWILMLPLFDLRSAPTIGAKAAAVEEIVMSPPATIGFAAGVTVISPPAVSEKEPFTRLTATFVTSTATLPEGAASVTPVAPAAAEIVDPLTLRSPVDDVIDTLPFVLVKFLVGVKPAPDATLMLLPATRSMSWVSVVAAVTPRMPAVASATTRPAVACTFTAPPVDASEIPPPVDVSTLPTSSWLSDESVIVPPAVIGAAVTANAPFPVVTDTVPRADVIACWSVNPSGLTMATLPCTASAIGTATFVAAVNARAAAAPGPATKARSVPSFTSAAVLVSATVPVRLDSVITAPAPLASTVVLPDTVTFPPA